jgi:hypothetical protein
MSDRIVIPLLCALIALTIVAVAHLAMPLLAFGWALAILTTLILAQRVGVTVWRTGWGCVPVARARASW